MLLFDDKVPEGQAPDLEERDASSAQSNGAEGEPWTGRWARRPTFALRFLSVVGRGAATARRGGCIASPTTSTRSSRHAFKSVSSLIFAEKISRAFLASYLLR